MPKKRTFNFSARNFLNVIRALLIIFAYIVIIISIIYIFTGFGDDSVTFWSYISALWVLAILLFHLADRWR